MISLLADWVCGCLVPIHKSHFLSALLKLWLWLHVSFLQRISTILTVFNTAHLARQTLTCLGTFGRHLPSIALKALADILSEGEIGVSIDGDAVVIVESLSHSKPFKKCCKSSGSVELTFSAVLEACAACCCQGTISFPRPKWPAYAQASWEMPSCMHPSPARICDKALAVHADTQMRSWRQNRLDRFK